MSDETKHHNCSEFTQVRVTVKSPQRPNVLASVSVEIQTDYGTIRIHDGRILRNKAGVAWFSLPTFSITAGKTYEYFPTVELPASLHRQVSDAALNAFEQWAAANGGAQ